MRDVRERKQNEEHIRLLSSALESAANAIVITDNKGTIIWSNRAFTILTGFTREEVLGDNPRILKSDLQDTRFYKSLWDTIRQGKVWKGELINRRKNRELYYEEMTITPVGSISENMTYFIAIKNDITERKKAEKDLIQAKEKAEESDRLKTVFLQNLSHEIRTPMNAIIGFSDLLDANIYEKEKMGYCTHIIKEKSHELLGIINEILDISMIEAGQMPVYKEEVNINNLLYEIYVFFEGYKSQIEKGNIAIKYYPIPDKFNSTVITDKIKLTQIFNNLLFNALKFTDSGEINFGYHSMQGDVLQFYISDTGMGIPANKQTLIFDRFRQADEGATRKKGGVGLGLSIVKGLVDLLEGSIRLSSEPGKGSTFYLTLPVQLAETGIDNAAAKELIMNRIKNKSILIVEDDYYNLDFLKETLISEGGKLTAARSGHEGREKIKGMDNLDIVLLDIGLPDINGLDLIPEIKAIFPAAVIIALTAYATPADKEKCLKAGCNDFISKPTNITTVLKKINSFS
jgi:PAS domain S-box-containing protein